MNIPIKVIKANSNPPSQFLSNHQNLAKKYSQIYKKKFANLQTNQNNSTNKSEIKKEGPEAENEKKILHIPNCSQDDVIKWFFSLDIKLRLKICSIENKWLVTIIYQMCKHTLYDERIKFLYKESLNKESNEEIPSIIYTNNTFTTASIINMNTLQNLSQTDSTNLNNYLNYFVPNNYVQTNINIEKFLNYNEKMERGFFTEIKFFQKYEMNDTICLSTKLISNETLFRQIFAYFTNEKFFRSFIGVSYDNKNKFYNFDFPNWMDARKYYSFFQWIAAFFEQSIMIWYFLYKNLNSTNFEALILDDKLNEVLEENGKMIKFLKNHSFCTTIDKKKFLNKINFKNISMEIRKDEKISQMISQRKKYVEIVNHCCNNNIIYFQNIDKRTVLEILDEAEHKIRDIFYYYGEEMLIEYLFFSSLEKMFSYDDVLNKRILGEIHNLYTTQNALDLIMEEILLSSSEYKSYTSPKKNTLNISEGNKKKNKSKKNKNASKRQIKELNLKNSHSSIEISESVSVKEDSGVEDFIKSILKDIMTNIEEIFFNKKYNDNKALDEDISSNYSNMSNCSYSSLSGSDRVTHYIPQRITIKNKKNLKPEKQSFFLYSTTKKSNAKEAAICNIKDSKQEVFSKKNIENRNNPNFNFPGEDILKLQKNSSIINDKTLIDKTSTNLVNSDKEIKDKDSYKAADTSSSIFEKEIKKKREILISNCSKFTTSTTNPDTINQLKINSDDEKRSSIISNFNTETGTTEEMININNNNNISHNQNNFMTSSSVINTSIYSHQIPMATQEIYKKFNQLNLLQNNIISYSKEVIENTTYLKEIKLSIISKVEQIIKSNLKDEYEINFSIYGSFATDLTIESSDIDITINYWPNRDDRLFSQKIIINKIVNILNKTNIEENRKIFDTINPIYTATVPVIKMHINILQILDGNTKENFEEFITSKNFSNINFKKEEIEKIKVDFTFNKHKFDSTNKIHIYENPALQIVDYIKNSLIYFPEMKSILFVVKRILKITKLNSSYNGGLSSFCLFIITLAFLKMRKMKMNMIITPNLGSILIEFLDFYSMFNFNNTFIDVNAFNPFVYVVDKFDQIPLILDPITYLNAGKTIFRIQEVQKCFRNILNLFHSDNLKEPDLINSLFEHLEKVQI